MHLDNLLLTQPTVTSVKFRLQFVVTMAQFAERIPWLNRVGNSVFFTDPIYFRDTLRGAFGCRVIPYQVVTADPAKELVGGMLYLSRSPEKFKDSRNTEIATHLEKGGSGYLTCLLVRSAFRGVGNLRLIRTALPLVLKERGEVWAVIDNPQFLQWLIHIGATLRSPLVNVDRRWIVSLGGEVPNHAY